MSDKDNFDDLSDDDFYDEGSEDNFEFDESDLDDFDNLDDLEDGESDSFDESWDDEQENAPAPTPQKKKGSGLSFNAMVIIGAIFLGIFIVYSQVRKEQAAIEIENPKEEVMPTALRMEGAFGGPGAIKKEVVEKAEKEPEEVDTLNQTEGFLFDVDILDEPKEGENDAPPMPSPISSDETNDAGTDKEVTLMEAMGEQEVMPSPNPPEENFEDMAPAPMAEADVVIQTQAAGLAEEVEEPEEEKAEEEAPVAMAEPADVSQKLDAILNRLDAMETRIANIEGGEQKKEVVSVQPKEEKPKPVVKAAPKKVDSKPAVTKKKTSSKSVVWELRAAQPGKAWVSQKGKRDMKPVVVGDSLSGIGRIQGIDLVNGRWVVRGSGGTIKQ